MRTILIIITAFAASSFILADKDTAIIKPRNLDPNSPDIIGQLYQIGFPKYTENEKLILTQAYAMQSKHDATFKRVIVGKSVFDYDGLVAMGEMHYHPDQKFPYLLTIGIRPHIDYFSKSFREYRIKIDQKGIVQAKSEVPYLLKQAEQVVAPDA